MENAQQLIDALGGSANVAEAIGKPVGTVASWKHRNAIPAEEWSNFIAVAEALKVEGVTPELLLKMFPQRKAEIHVAPRDAGASTMQTGAPV